jgi:hypothetical protein
MMADWKLVEFDEGCGLSGWDEGLASRYIYKTHLPPVDSSNRRRMLHLIKLS